MDPVVQATLIGGIAGTFIGWAMICGYFMVGQRIAKAQARVADTRVVADSHLEPMFGRAISDWERVFTLRPVRTLDHGWVFCRHVWRRRIAKHSFLPSGGSDYWFQYLVRLQYKHE